MSGSAIVDLSPYFGTSDVVGFGSIDGLIRFRTVTGLDFMLQPAIELVDDI